MNYEHMAKLTPIKKGTAKLEAELAKAWRDIETLSVVELAGRNANVSEYVKHWEGRATKAEQQVEADAALMRQAREALKESHPEAYRHTIAAIDEALAEQQSGIKQVIELYDSPEQPARQDYWQEEARRYAQNAEFWRGKYEATTAQQQEPVAWIEHGSDEVPSVVVWERGSSGRYTPLYTSSRPNKPWVGLTDEEGHRVVNNCKTGSTREIFRAIEAKLREKNAQPSKPLTDEQIHKASTQAGMQEHYMGFHSGFIRFARAIEAAHGIKGDA